MSRKQDRERRHRERNRAWTVLAVALALLCLAGAASAEAPGRLLGASNGTVSGGVHVEAHQPVPWTSQETGATSREFAQAFSLPDGATGSSVAWARLYVSVYAGSADSSWKALATVSFDGDGDGNYEKTLGTETMATADASTDGTVYVVNDHCTRVYSDFLAWYDVTGLIASPAPAARVRTEPVEDASFDGRLKAVALVVAYDDGDGDEVRYWVNDGHAWVNAATAPTTTAFDTVPVPAGFVSATLDTLALSSRDGAYAFNGEPLAGADPVAPVNFFEHGTWDVTPFITPGTGSTLSMEPGTGASSFKAVLAVLAVRSPAPAAPDIAVTSIAPNPGAGDFLFAREPNVIAVTIENRGSGPAQGFTLAVDAGGTVVTEAGGPLEAGENTTVAVVDGSSREGGTNVTVSATADSAGGIDETDESNNTLSTTLTVYNNGYKGKRWTGGEDLATQQRFEGTIDLVYSAGNSAYAGAGWTGKTWTWSATDLPVPDGATVMAARLYQGFTYNKMGADPSWDLAFNGETVAPVAAYSDIKGFGSYSYPYGLYVYDVTGAFDTAGNSMTITPEAGQNYGIYGAYLVVVFADEQNATPKEIWINDGFDMVQSQTGYSVSTEEATAYATFSGINGTGVTSANATAILASAADADKSAFFFNDEQYTGFWPDYLKGPQVGFSTYDVTDALVSGDNEASLQSVDSGTKGDNMYAMNVILVVERGGPAVLAVPPETALPADTDGDGLYDDVNGNGRKDFQDIVLFFNQIAWIEKNEPLEAFDCNGNGRIDFADVVWLFSNL